MKIQFKVLVLLLSIFFYSCRKDEVRESEQFLVGTWELRGNTYVDSSALPDPNPEYSSDEEFHFDRSAIDSTIFIAPENIFFKIVIPYLEDTVAFHTYSRVQIRKIQKVKLIEKRDSHLEYFLKTKYYSGTEAVPMCVRSEYSLFVIHEDTCT